MESVVAKYVEEQRGDHYSSAFYSDPSPFPVCSFPRLTLEDIDIVIRNELKKNTATGLDGLTRTTLKLCLIVFWNLFWMFFIFASKLADSLNVLTTPILCLYISIFLRGPPVLL